MRPSGGRRIALGTAVAGILLLAGAGFAARGLILELWAIHVELRPEDETRQRKRPREGEPDGEARMRAAIEWLEARRSVRAAPRLLEIAAREHSRLRLKAQDRLDGSLPLPELALRALRSLPLDEGWYIARLRLTGEEREGERLVAIRRLAELQSLAAVPRLEEIAREEGRLGYAAAAALARILPALSLEGITTGERGERVARFRLRNPAPRSIWFEGYSIENPINSWVEMRSERWVRASPLGWCGTGIEDIELEPGAETSFEAVVPSSLNPLRIGIKLVDPPPPFLRLKQLEKIDDLFRSAVWSPEIPPGPATDGDRARDLRESAP